MPPEDANSADTDQFAPLGALLAESTMLVQAFLLKKLPAEEIRYVFDDHSKIIFVKSS